MTLREPQRELQIRTRVSIDKVSNRFRNVLPIDIAAKTMTEKSGGDAVVGGRARISTQIYKRVLAETKLRELGMVWVVHKSHA